MPTTGTTRKSVLIVEDVAVTALALADALEDEGYRILGPCGSCSEALALLRTDTPDYAILDITLRGSSCLAVARELRQRGVPFLIHSGWAPLQPMPEELAGMPWLEKPVSFGALVEGLEALEHLSRQKRQDQGAIQVCP